MKTLFFKKGIMLLATLFVAGITLSCHDADDEQEEQEKEIEKQIETQNQKQSTYQVGDFVKHIDDITAVVSFNQDLNEWYLQFHVPLTIDVIYQYYPSKLDEKFQQEGAKVVFSGDVYETSIHSGIARLECYRVILTSIREWTVNDVQRKVGYWYSDDFIELVCCDPNAYLVQARATKNPISYERVEEILTSLGAEITYSSGTSFFFVHAEQRPVHPDLFVSPEYKPIDRRWGDSELWINPSISIKLNEGASWEEVLSKYGAHLREKEQMVEMPKELRSFDCDLPTAEVVMRLAATIHIDPDVNWCAPSIMAKIIFD